MREASGRFEERHAVAAAGDQQRAEFHGGKRCATAARQLVDIGADRGVMQGFEFGFVGSRGGDAGFRVRGQGVAGVEGDHQRFAFCGDLANELRRGDAETVVGNGEGVR